MNLRVKYFLIHTRLVILLHIFDSFIDIHFSSLMKFTRSSRVHVSSALILLNVYMSTKLLVRISYLLKIHKILLKDNKPYF